MNHTFSIQEALLFGWHKTRAHSSVLIPAALILTVLQIVTNYFLAPGAGTAGEVGAGLLFFLSFMLTTGFIRICLKLARGEHALLRDLMPPSRTFGLYLVAALLQLAVMVVGFIALIVPGLYALVRLFFMGYAAIDGAGPKEAFRESVTLTDGAFWRMAGFILLTGVAGWVGGYVYVTLLLSLPIMTLASAHVYLKLKNHP